VFISNITTKRATISWSTNRTADSRIQYGTSSGDYFDEEPSKSEQVTSHSINLTNLEPGKKYYFVAKWTDEDGNTGISDEQTFETEPAPEVSSVEVSNISINSALVSFVSSNSASVTLQYGESTAFGGSTTIATSSEESTYTISLVGLKDSTQYYLRLVSKDSEDDEYESDSYTFTTLPRPQISNPTIQQIPGVAQPAMLVSWDTNTDISSVITYYPSATPANARDQVNVERKAGRHKMIIRGLLPQTPYSLVISGRDAVGNEAITDPLTITTATDTRAPKISDLRVEGSTSSGSSDSGQQAKSQLVISWTTDEPATSQVEFGEGTGTTYSQTTQEDSNLTYNHMVIISELTPSNVYHLRALSKDEAGNVSESIDKVTITPKATDNALDLVITNLQEAFGISQ
jgi:hypothetical protein